MIWTRIEPLGDRFVAIASAMPENSGLRCSPQQRMAVCTRREEAEIAAERVARELLEDLTRRGFSN